MDHIKQFPTPLPEDDLSNFEEIPDGFGLTSFELLSICRLPEEEGVARLSQRVSCPIAQARKVLHNIREQLLNHKVQARSICQYEDKILTGLRSLDLYFSGGIPRGAITEVFGSSGCGKSQFLLQMALQAQLKCDQNGVPGRSIYISTESALETRRLSEMATSKTSLPANALGNISYIYCQDGESQDHILFTQLPSKLRASQADNENVTIVLIDSIGHHFRLPDSYINNLAYLKSHLEQQEAELQEIPSYPLMKSKFDKTTMKYFRGHSSYRNRKMKKLYLLDLYRHLSNLALTFNVAIIVANQVSDLFEHNEHDGISNIEGLDPMNLNMQVGTFSGWSEVISEHIELNDIHRKPDGMKDNMIRNGETTKRRKLQEKSGSVYLTLKTSNAPPKKILALGYTWAKLVSNKILLWKVYHPNCDPEHTNISSNVLHSQNSSSKTTSSDHPEEKGLEANSSNMSTRINGWTTSRFMKVIEPFNANQSQVGPGITFAICKDGLVET